jgi:group I intron endonuclease
MKGIYKITNPSGKIYIGQSGDIDKRIKRYQTLQCKGQRILYNSLKKYGWNNHFFEIIEIVDNDDNLMERETFWKIHYKVLEIPSLCCRIDGREGKMSKESCIKLSNSIKKYWKNLNNEDYKERIKKHKPTNETIEKIRTSHIGKKKSSDHIKNLKLSQNKPETVKKRKESLKKYWDSMTEEKREELRQLNIQTQNRPDVKEKLSINNPSRKSEVREKQSKSALNKQKLECPHCGKVMDSSNAKKYHFDKCKLTV